MLCGTFAIKPSSLFISPRAVCISQLFPLVLECCVSSVKHDKLTSVQLHPIGSSSGSSLFPCSPLALSQTDPWNKSQGMCVLEVAVIFQAAVMCRWWRRKFIPEEVLHGWSSQCMGLIHRPWMGNIENILYYMELACPLSNGGVTLWSQPICWGTEAPQRTSSCKCTAPSSCFPTQRLFTYTVAQMFQMLQVLQYNAIQYDIISRKQNIELSYNKNNRNINNNKIAKIINIKVVI